MDGIKGKVSSVIKGRYHRYGPVQSDSGGMRNCLIIATLAALLAFICVFAFSDRAKTIFAVATGIGTGALTYLAAQARQQRKG